MGAAAEFLHQGVGDPVAGDGEEADLAAGGVHGAGHCQAVGVVAFARRS